MFQTMQCTVQDLSRKVYARQDVYTIISSKYERCVPTLNLCEFHVFPKRHRIFYKCMNTRNTFQMGNMYRQNGN